MKRVDFHGLRELLDKRIRVLLDGELPAILYVSISSIVVHFLHVQLTTLNGLHKLPLSRVIQ